MLGNSTDKQYIAENTVTQFTTRCIGEWNMNMYTDIDDISDSVYGTEATEFYKNFFPLDSVVKGWRPTSGILKPRKKWARWRRKGWRNVAALTAVTGGYVLKPRMYYARKNNAYKYWESPTKISAGTVVPTITYSSPVWTNKLTVTFVNLPKPYAPTLWDSPTAFQIQYRTGASTWNNALSVSGYTMPDDGVVSVYSTGGGSWTSTQPTSPSLSTAIQITGIRVSITACTDSSMHPAIIEMSPRMQLDLTSRLKEWSFDSNLAEESDIFPVGTISSNSGSIVLSNNDGLLEPGLAGGGTIDYSDVMKKYGKISLYTTAVTGGASEVPLFTAYTEDPVLSGNKDSLTFDLFDYAKILQDQKVSEIAINDCTPTAAIWSILDAAGHNNVLIKRATDEHEVHMRWFYTEPEQSVWDAIEEICTSNQYAVYVDEQNRIVIATRGYLYSGSSGAYTFTTDPVTDGGLNYKPNISNFSEDAAAQAVNMVNVSFRPLDLYSVEDPDSSKYTKPNQVAFNRRGTLELYRPNQPVLLSCASLVKPMTNVQTYMYINNTAVRNAQWGDFAGYVIIDSEVIKFDGLEYAYTPKSGAPAGPAIVKSLEDLNEVYAYSQGIVTFTGKVCNLTRAQFGTKASAHNLSLSSWTVTRYASIVGDTLGNKFLRINNKTASARRVTFAHKVVCASSKWTNTKIQIVDAKTKQRAGGIVTSVTYSGAGISGIYVEISNKDNTNTGYLRVYKVTDSIIGKKPLASKAIKTPEGRAFDLSVYFAKVNTKDGVLRRLAVDIDGQRELSTFLANGTVTDRIALVATGDSIVQFDYVAGGTSQEDIQTKYDGSIKKYISGMLERDRGWKDNLAMPDLSKVGFERFDDYVRGIYVDTVKYSRGPALTSDFTATSTNVRDALNRTQVALGNDIASAISERTPWGSTIAVANCSSRPVILVNVTANGDILYPFISGEVINEFEQVTVKEKDDKSINRLGEKKLELSPKWINSRSMATALAKWILSRSKTGVKRITVDVWSGHIIQVGDVIKVMKKVSNSVTTSELYMVSGSTKSGDSNGFRTSFRLVKI
jgi:hypothetical protein